MKTSRHRTCPNCDKAMTGETKRCGSCGVHSSLFVAKLLAQGVFALIVLGWMFSAFVGWKMDSVTHASPVPSGGVKYQGETYGQWMHTRNADIERTLEQAGAYCPDYKYRKSIDTSEYVVYCLMKYENGTVPVSAYVVFPLTGTVIGPTSTDKKFN